MKTTTRTLALMAAAALVVSACGRDEDGETEDGAQAESVTEGPAEGTIEVWAMGAEGENLDVLGAAFTEENPDATVEVTPVPWEGAHDKIATAIADTPNATTDATSSGWSHCKNWIAAFCASGKTCCMLELMSRSSITATGRPPGSKTRSSCGRPLSKSLKSRASRSETYRPELSVTDT